MRHSWDNVGGMSTDDVDVFSTFQKIPLYWDILNVI